MIFFCKQCTPVPNDRILPVLLKTPNETLSSLGIIASDFGKALKMHKALGHDEMSIGCSSYVNKPLRNRFIWFLEIVLALILSRMFGRR